MKVCSSKCRHTTYRTSESRDVRLHSTKFVATQQPRSKAKHSRLQNLGLTARTGLFFYNTSIKDVDELRRRIAEEWDKLVHRIKSSCRMVKDTSSACGQFGHKMWTFLSFLIFCIGILWPTSLKYCCFSVKTGGFVEYIACHVLHFVTAIQRIFIKHAIANHILWKWKEIS